MQFKPAVNKADLLVLTAILMISISAGFFMHSVIHKHTDTYIKQYHEMLSKSTIRTINDRLDDFSNAITKTRIASAMSTAQNLSALSQHISQDPKSGHLFDDLLMVVKQNNGNWQFVRLYEDKPTNQGQSYRLHDYERIASILAKDIFQQGKTRAFTNLPFKEITSETEDPVQKNNEILTAPFALVTDAKLADGHNAIIIGLANMNFATPQEWISFAEIGHLRLREPNSEYSIFYYDDNKTDARDNMYAYKLDFAGSQWEVSLAYDESKLEIFFKFLPLIASIIAALFVFCFSGLAVALINRSRAFKDFTSEQENLQSEIERAQKKTSLSSKNLSSYQTYYQSFFNSLEHVVFELDYKGTIMFISNQWFSFAGYDPESTKDKDLISFIDQDTQEEFNDMLKAVIAGKELPLSLVTQLSTQTKGTIAVEIVITSYLKTYKTPRLIGYISDLSTHLEAEKALQETEQKYRTIVENAAGGIFQLFPEGQYLSVNPSLARILGYDSADDLIENVTDASQNIYVNSGERRALLRKLETEDEITYYETQLRKKNGEIIWAGESIRAIKSDEGNVLYYEGSLEDITERHETLTRLNDAMVASDMANRAKSDFLANMSHELRTPLNSIIGFSEIIKTEALGPVQPAEYGQYANDIYNSGQYLLTIINQILDISKIETGDRVLNEDEVDMTPVIKECIELTEPKMKENKITFHYENNVPDKTKIVSEKRALKQVIMNLLSNAVKFTPKDGKVTLSTKIDREGQYVIAISDTGIGMDEDEVVNALSPFGQVQNELSRSNSGTGLGLTIAEALVKLHDGRLELFSQKGIGTTATVIIPKERVRS